MGCLQNTLEEWIHRRYSWRFSWLYKRIAIVLFFLTIMSFVFYGLGTGITCSSFDSCGYFANYECSRESLLFIMNGVMTQNWVWFIYGIVLLLLAIVLNMFTDYSMKDFMDAGRWGALLGCAVKYLPWLVWTMYMVWLILAILSLIFIVVFNICSNRMNIRGVAAVKNCRLYNSQYLLDRDAVPDSCLSITPQIGSSALWSCNSITYLKTNRFAVLDCQLRAGIQICDAYDEVARETAHLTMVEAYNWLNPNLYCLSDRPPVYVPQEDEVDDGNIPDSFWHDVGFSDMFRYAFLWALASAFMVVSISISTAMIRAHSPVESSFYTPKEEGDFCIVAMYKNISPWNVQ